MRPTEARDQIAALPDDALTGYAEALGVLKLIPRNGEPINKHNPTGPVRTLPFGAAGMVRLTQGPAVMIDKPPQPAAPNSDHP